MTGAEKKSSKMLSKGKNLLNIWQTIKKPGADRAFLGLEPRQIEPRQPPLAVRGFIA
jgi:hypothetical protein